MESTHRSEVVPIAVGCDHAGIGLKTELAEALKAEGYVVEDFGVFSAETNDYPDIAREVAEVVAADKFARAILVCGSGIGMSIAANKINGIRAVCSEPYSAIMSRKHNNANILCLGARVVGIGLGMEICRAFLETGFEFGTRHEMRVGKISELEQL